MEKRRHPIIRVLSSSASSFFASKDEEDVAYSSSDSEGPRIPRVPQKQERQFAPNKSQSIYIRDYRREKALERRQKEQQIKQKELKEMALQESRLRLPQDPDDKSGGTSRASPRLSPRLVAEHMKRKLSEAILPKQDNVTFMSDQMASSNFRTLETFLKEDDLAGLRSFLSSRPVVVDDRDENGSTILMAAASRGMVEYCTLLLNHGADINAEDNDKWTALISAAKEGCENVLPVLLSYGASVHHRDMGSWNALMWACYKGYTSMARLLIVNGSDVNILGQHNMTPLVWAAGRGHTEIVTELLSHNAKVNVADKFGTTPLIWACRKGFYTICEALLKNGANVDATGMYLWTPLLVAAKGNYIDVVRLLFEYKPNVNALDKDGATALIVASKEGYFEIVSSLLSAGAYVNIQDRNGDTSLIYACRGGHKLVVEMLLKKYADVNIIGKDKKTALFWAVEKGHVDVVEVLLKNNVDVQHTTKNGDTPLLRAVRIKNVEIVQMLIKKADVTVADKNGDTALHIAMRGRSKRIVDILLRNPKNSQLLYRPNCVGETPYNIDYSHQCRILGNIYGARRLNANKDIENMLGYDLYSSTLADILSEPSLSMPISVGLFARWGSGKSFLLLKLIALSYIFPSKPFVPLIIGGIVAASVFGLSLLFLLTVWYGSRRYDWRICYLISVAMAKYLQHLKLVLQVMFCSPPGPKWRQLEDSQHALPLKFIFGEGAKPNSTLDSENLIVQMIGSLYDMVEKKYGLLSTRLYRAFRPKADNSESSWSYRRLCCIPYIFIFYFTLTCILCGSVMIFIWLGQDLPSDTIHHTHSIGLELDDDDDDAALSKESSYESHDGEFTLNKEFSGDEVLRPFLITIGVFVAMIIIAHLHTFTNVFISLLFSNHTHLVKAMAKLETVKTEGFMQVLKSEVNLLVEMVKCLDAFTLQQTRMVVIVNGLDSCEQEKVLNVLDAVNDLFTDSSAPFVILLAIDPHIMTKVIETGGHRVFRESSISGHDYLRNSVHLPFFLQNSGLRRAQQAQQVAEKLRGKQSSWLEMETDSTIGGISHLELNRALSSASEYGYNMSSRKLSYDSVPGIRRNTSRSGRYPLRQLDSVTSSIASNLNRVGGVQDLTKVLLTDEYFSDINPRSMRRLMNVVHITARLLKAFHIDFSWCHLASWINITEQWPYKTSLVIFYCEEHEDSVEEKVSLKDIYEKVKTQEYSVKDSEMLSLMDKEEAKFEVFLKDHRNSLNVATLKVIKDDQPQLEVPFNQFAANPLVPWSLNPLDLQSKSSSLSRKQVEATHKLSSVSAHHLNPYLFGYPPYVPTAPDQCSVAGSHIGSLCLPPGSSSKRLSQMIVDEVFELFSKVQGVSQSHLAKYKGVFIEHNITGRVLLHCSLEDLKKTLSFTFGDWELFKMLILGLREVELTAGIDDDIDGRSSHGQEEEGSYRGITRVPLVHKEDSHSIKRKQSVTKMVNLEEQMIFGALQTLNEEACEDVCEEKVKSECLSIAAVEQCIANDGGIKCSTTSSLSETHKDEVDVIYLKSSPLLSHRVVTCPSDSESAAPSVGSGYSPCKVPSGSFSFKVPSTKKLAIMRHESSASSSPVAVTTPEDEHFSPTILNAEDEYSFIKRDRPKSLNLGSIKHRHEKLNHSLRASEMKSFSDEMIGPSIDTSFPEISSITDQVSFSSTEKLRRLKNKLHRAVAITDSIPFTKPDPESSPLVLAKSPACYSAQFTNSSESPKVENTVNAEEKGKETPL